MNQPQDITNSLPFAPDMEKGLLSCFINAPASLLPDARSTVPPEWFYHPAFRLIFETMLARFEAGHPVDYLSFCQYATDSGLIDKMGGQGMLAEILDFVPTPAHYGWYKSVVRDKATLRRLIEFFTKGASECYTAVDEIPALLGRLTEGFIQLSKQGQDTGRKSFKQILYDYADAWERRAKGETPVGIPTRWRCFNSTFGGITPTFWLIAGFPSDGKSTLVQNMAEDAIAHRKHVLWFSYEMSETELCDRLVTSHSQLDSQEVFFPQNGVSRDAQHKIGRAVADMAGWGMHLRCEATWTCEQIVAEARALSMKHDLGLVIVDYLQLVPPSGRGGPENRSQEVALMSRAFKLASLALKMPFVVLSQLNDDGKTKESRAPNQDASNILFIEKEHTTKDKGKEKTFPACLRVVKNRNGKRGHCLPIRLCGQNFTFNEDLKPEDYL